MYLINLETSGNQAYIFASNKLRNITGASELLYRVGTKYVELALKKVSGRDFKIENIIDEQPIENQNSPDFEIIIATSGKALLLAKNREAAKNFITEWSKIVITEAPGVDALAVCSENSFEPSSSITEYIKVFRETEREMTLLRINEGSSLARFQRIPVTAECVYSGFPASFIEDDKPISEKSLAQRKASNDSDIKFRMKKLFPVLENTGSNILNGLESLEKLDWLAVIHADGNGLGQLFINLAEYVQNLAGEKATGRDYINYYRKFSSALDKISWLAFNKAVWQVWGNTEPQIVPIVVGGDDLTVVMDGYESLKFAESFMINFCKATQEDIDTKTILECSGVKSLGMCAGISIAKPHFPFSQSYKLAEELMKSAKRAKNQYGADSIAVDFHILYDSVVYSMSDIRDKIIINNRVLTQKPYIIFQGQTLNHAPDYEWQVSHNYDTFKKAVEAIKYLPSSQAHGVRDDIFSQQRETQEAEWQFLLTAYPEFKTMWENVDKNLNLYTNENDKFSTVFLDALEMKKFLDDKEHISE